MVASLELTRGIYFCVCSFKKKEMASIHDEDGDSRKRSREETTFPDEDVVVHYDIDQQTPEWDTLRRPVSGSRGELFGLSVFDSASSAYCRTIHGIEKKFPSRAKAAMQHGVLFEPQSALELRDLLAKTTFPSIDKDTNRAWREQRWFDNPGYDIPNHRHHPFFKEERDEQRFGVSLDMRGEYIDVEIKNPVSYLNFKRYYYESLSPERFFQLQWAMAVRNRQAMFLYATCYDAETKKLRASVLWHVVFQRNFMVEQVIPRARRIADAILAKDQEFDIEECTLAKVFVEGIHESFEDEYAETFSAYARRIHSDGL